MDHQISNNKHLLLPSRGGAYGFRLDILTKINDFKTNDNKKTLLYTLIEHIYDNKNEELLDITKEFANLNESNYKIF